MSNPLNIVFVEDNPADFMLLERFLRKQAMLGECQRVSTAEDLDRALQREWDVVLTDYNLPGMNFAWVVQHIKARWPDVPIILVSGSLEEYVAAEMLRVGLSDFILKSHLIRLPSAIQHAIEQAQEHRARRIAEVQLQATQAAALQEQHRARIAALNLMEDALVARERAEAATVALQASEEKYRLLSENAADWIFWQGTDGRFKYVSPACERITGYAAADFLAHHDLLHQIIYPEDQATYQQHLQDAQTSENSELEYRIVDKTGKIHWIAHHCQPMYNANGDYWGRHGTNRDITVRKAAEAQRDLLSAALRQAAQPLLLADDNTCITYINPAFTALFGYTLADLLGKPVSYLTTTSQASWQDQATMQAQIQAKGSWSGEGVRITKAGIPIPTAVSIGMIRDERGQHLGFVGSYLDLRPLHEKEMLLRKLSMAVEQSPGSIAITDLRANIEYVNESFVRNTGYSREELMGKNQRMLHSGKTSPKVYASLWRSLQAGETWQGHRI